MLHPKPDSPAASDPPVTSSALAVLSATFPSQRLSPPDEDVFRLEIPAATDVVLYTTGSTNTRGYLSGVGPRRLATSNDGGRGANFMIRRRLNPGVYHVTVSGLDGFAGIGPYALHAEVPPTAPPMNITVLRDGSSLVVTWDAVPPELAGAPSPATTPSPPPPTAAPRSPAPHPPPPTAAPSPTSPTTSTTPSPSRPSTPSATAPPAQPTPRPSPPTPTPPKLLARLAPKPGPAPHRGRRSR